MPYACKAGPLPDPNPGFINYPEVAHNGFFAKHLEDTAKDRHYMRLVLLGKAQNQQAGMLLRRVEPQIGEICIQCHQNSIFGFTDSSKVKVLTTPQPTASNDGCTRAILPSISGVWSGIRGIDFLFQQGTNTARYVRVSTLASKRRSVVERDLVEVGKGVVEVV